MLHVLEVTLEVYLVYAALSFLYCGLRFALHLRRERAIEGECDAPLHAAQASAAPAAALRSRKEEAHVAKIIPFTPAAAADLAAQHLYLSVAAHTQAIEHLLDNIAFTTVSGAETRADLARSAELLSEARALLERVEVRESPKYLRSSGANRWD